MFQPCTLSELARHYGLARYVADNNLHLNSFQVMFWLRASNPMYKDINYIGCSPPNGVLTQLRQWMGIGGVPKMTKANYDAFERGEYAVGKAPKIKQIEEANSASNDTSSKEVQV